MRIVAALALVAGAIALVPMLVPMPVPMPPAGALAPASSLNAATASATQTQAFTGGGAGMLRFHHQAPDTVFGNYTSSGQLGRGDLDMTFETGNRPVPAKFTRSDGMTMTGSVRFYAHSCPSIPIGPNCRIFDLDGTADIAHAHIELIRDSRGNLQVQYLMRGTLTLRQRVGYAMVDATGAPFTFGGIDHRGDAHTSYAIGLELTPSGAGYWVANAYGQVYAFGDAPDLGNADISTFNLDELVTSISATPTGKGYWLFTSRGRAVAFGDARFLGDLHAIALSGGIVGSIATPTGHGYYMVGADGGVFAFGDAKFHGSTGAMHLNQPVVGLVPTQNKAGYWLVAADGGVFSFNAPFLGSMGAVTLNRPIVTMVPYGRAYMMVASDGGVFNFSRAPFFGSLGGTAIPQPITDAAAMG